MSRLVGLNDLTNKSKKISFVMLCIMVTYVTFAGTASFFSVGSISLWRVLVGLTCVTALPVIAKNIKDILKSPFLYIIIGFGVWLIVSAFVGISNKNSTGLIIRDIKCFLYIALYPVIRAILCEKRQINTLLKCVMYSSFALSILTCIFMFAYLVLPSVSKIMIREFWRLSFINYTPISSQIARILFVSTPFIIIGCVISCYFQVKNERFSVLYSTITGIGLFSILITYTRALYLAAFVAAVAIVVALLITADYKSKSRLVKHLVVVFVIFAMVTVVFSLIARTNYFSYAVSRVFATGADSNIYTGEDGVPTDPDIPEFNDEASYLEATKVSDQIRSNLRHNLKAAIVKSPIIGNGLGLSINGRQSLPELFYLDLFAKTGVIGIALFLAPAVLAAFIAIRSMARRRFFIEHYVYLCGIIGLLLYALYQPYMNNAPCMVIYCVLFAIAETKYANKPKHTLLDK